MSTLFQEIRLPLLFSVGEDFSVPEVVALSFVPAVLYVVYVLWTDRASSDPD